MRHGMIVVCLLVSSVTSLAETTQIRLRVLNDEGAPLPCRIHVTDAAGHAVIPPSYPSWKNHFVCDGTAEVKVPTGTCTLIVERGPEYRSVQKELDLTKASSADDVVEISIVLKRICELRKLGWYSGDLHIHRNPEDVPFLMQAEDLDVAPVITWWNDSNLWKDRPLPNNPRQVVDSRRFMDVMAGEDEREGGALLYFGLSQPLAIQGAGREYPSPMKFVGEAIEVDPATWIDIEKPFWWDMPVWVASGQVKSIGIANNHMCRSQMLENEAWGRPRDPERLPPPLGNGYWTQEIYYHLLNCGIRIPPSAGSASGVLPNPVGYNRVYVQVDGALDWMKWWDGLAAGRCFVTNGPLLVCRVNDELPGHVFRLTDQPIKLNIDLTVLSDNAVERVELIHNGEILRSVHPRDVSDLHYQADRPGWFLIRAMTGNRRTFRFASTAPWYVEGASGERHISRSSVRFFLDWLKERRARVVGSVSDQEQLRSILVHHDNALRFWTERLNQVSSD